MVLQRMNFTAASTYGVVSGAHIWSVFPGTNQFVTGQRILSERIASTTHMIVTIQKRTAILLSW
jgi:hypothetical protein